MVRGLEGIKEGGDEGEEEVVEGSESGGEELILVIYFERDHLMDSRC
jgi:hypothetical protein